MANGFWGCQRIIFFDYLEKAKTIRDANYASLLNYSNKELQEKRPRLAHKLPFLLQRNGSFRLQM